MGTEQDILYSQKGMLEDMYRKWLFLLTVFCEVYVRGIFRDQKFHYLEWYAIYLLPRAGIFLGFIKHGSSWNSSRVLYSYYHEQPKTCLKLLSSNWSGTECVCWWWWSFFLLSMSMQHACAKGLPFAVEFWNCGVRAHFEFGRLRILTPVIVWFYREPRLLPLNLRGWEPEVRSKGVRVRPLCRRGARDAGSLPGAESLPGRPGQEHCTWVAPKWPFVLASRHFNMLRKEHDILSTQFPFPWRSDCSILPYFLFGFHGRCYKPPHICAKICFPGKLRARSPPL